MVNVRLSDVVEKIYVEACPIKTRHIPERKLPDLELLEQFPEGFPLYVTIEPVHCIEPWISSVYVACGQLLLPDFSDTAFDFELGKTLNVSRIPRGGYSHADILKIKTPDSIEVRDRSEVRYKFSALLEAIDGEPGDGQFSEARQKNGLEILEKMITALFGLTNGKYSSDGNDIRERIEGVIKPLSEKAEQYVRQDYEKILREQLSAATFPLTLEGKVYSFEIKDNSIQLPLR